MQQPIVYPATVPPPPGAAPRRTVPPFVGWILIGPAALLLLLNYVWPTSRLLWDGMFGRGVDGTWRFLFSANQLGQLGYALSYALLPILLIATVAPALAWAASRAGLVGRWALRAALALPLAAFAPAGLALVWADRNTPEDSATSIGPTFADWDGRLAMLSTMAAFLVAVPVVCYLAAYRRRAPGERSRAAVIVVGVLLAIVALGVAVQQYTFVALVDQNPINAIESMQSAPAMTLEVGFFSARQAVFALPILFLVGVLGVAAALIVLRSGLRLEFDPAVRSADDVPGPGPGRRRTVALIGTVAGIVGLLLLIVFQLGPWLAAVAGGETRLPSRYPASAVLNSTWLIPLGAALVQVAVAAVAAFGIAVVRPLGRHSEWLLLAFAPWLLAGNALMELPRLGPGGDQGPQPLLAHAPSSWLSIPALFLFTLLLRGQVDRWSQLWAARQPSAFLRAMWPVLPMAVLAVGVAWLLQAQDLLLPTMVDSRDGVVPNAQLIMARAGRLPRSVPYPALGYPLLLLVLFTLGGLALQWAFLDRVAVRLAGRDPVRERPVVA
jgi:hypothetical protein